MGVGGNSPPHRTKIHVKNIDLAQGDGFVYVCGCAGFYIVVCYVSLFLSYWPLLLFAFVVVVVFLTCCVCLTTDLLRLLFSLLLCVSLSLFFATLLHNV